MLNTYIGIDSREILPSGVYAGLPNPNFGRLTFLHAHPYFDVLPNNHYHGIGSWTYLGAAGSAVATNSNAGNRIPEVYTALPPLTLVSATAAYPAYAGRRMSLKTEEQYSDMRVRPTWDLKQYPTNTAEYYMFISSAGTRTNSLVGIRPALHLIPASNGPWTSYTNLQHTVERVGAGETAQQTNQRYYTIPRTGDMRFFRMQKP
jgi:hypothetical protein